MSKMMKKTKKQLFKMKKKMKGNRLMIKLNPRTKTKV